MQRNVKYQNYELSNHLGNVLTVITDRKLPQENPGALGTVEYYTADVVAFNDYYPFGMLMPGRNSGEDFRFGFNGMELDNEISGGGNSYDFGARMLNPRVGRFFSQDPYVKRFAYQSSYIVAGNTPIWGQDINGDSLYILQYVSSDPSSKMFKSAAYTRKYDIENSKGFDPLRDKVIVLQVANLSLIEETVENTIAENKDVFGKTVEYGLWSHSALDGPIGSKKTSSNAIDGYQMLQEGWSDIDFNWSDGDGNRAGFYGCNSGNDILGSSFTNKLSSNQNFKDVLLLLGQTKSSYPSIYTDKRNVDVWQFLNRYRTPVSDEFDVLFKTYMVGSAKKR